MTTKTYTCPKCRAHMLLRKEKERDLYHREVSVNFYCECACGYRTPNSATEDTLCRFVEKERLREEGRKARNEPGYRDMVRENLDLFHRMVCDGTKTEALGQVLEWHENLTNDELAKLIASLTSLRLREHFVRCPYCGAEMKIKPASGKHYGACTNGACTATTPVCDTREQVQKVVEGTRVNVSSANDEPRSFAEIRRREAEDDDRGDT